MRVCAIIAYDGSRFEGFQRQKHTPMTVAGNIEYALKKIGIDTTIVGSGRTDKGVHATGQVIHFDTPAYHTNIQKLHTLLNSKLQAISIRRLFYVDQSFHARYSALLRCYRYIFSTSKPHPFQSAYLSYHNRFDPQKLQQAIHCFKGEHDFCLFQKSGSSPKHTIRHITTARYHTYRQYHIITFCANGFLRSQVRMMIDAAFRVANNQATIQELLAQLSTNNHTFNHLAPPNGLYLTHVRYHFAQHTANTTQTYR